MAERQRLSFGWAIPAAFGALLFVLAPSSADNGTEDTPRYSQNGELLVPREYETWIFIGSNLGLAYKQDVSAMTALETRRADQVRFHNVYINRAAYAQFVSSGTFPDLTVLVMEAFEAAEKESNGVLAGGSFNGTKVGTEVAVKNSSRPDGRGTPWAYYDFTDPANPSKVRSSASAFPDSMCENCHRQHASIDNVWVQFYPILRNRSK